MSEEFRTYIADSPIKIFRMERLRKRYPNSIKVVYGIRSKREYRISKKWIDEHGETLIHEKYHLTDI